MGLFSKPPWMDKDAKKAMAAVNAVEDPKTLQKIVMGYSTDELRLCALRRLAARDQAALPRIVQKAVEQELRAATIAEMRDPAALLLLATQSKRPDVCVRALVRAASLCPDRAAELACTAALTKAQAQRLATFIDKGFRTFDDCPRELESEETFRLAAVHFLTEQAKLSELVRSGMFGVSTQMRLAAAARITDADAANAACQGNSDPDVRLLLLPKLSDRALFERSAAWMPSASVPDMDAFLSRCPEPWQREALARSCQNPIGQAALARIESPETLSALALTLCEKKGAEDNPVLRALLPRLQETDCAACLLSFRGMAEALHRRFLYRITAQPLLKCLALGNHPAWCEQFGVPCLPGDKRFAPAERIYAVERVKDPALLAFLAREERVSSNVRMAAVRRVEDPAMLAALAKDADDLEVRAAVLPRLQDQAVLWDVALNGPARDPRQTDGIRLRRIAAGYVADKAALANALLSETDLSLLYDCLSVHGMQDAAAPEVFRHVDTLLTDTYLPRIQSDDTAPISDALDLLQDLGERLPRARGALLSAFSARHADAVTHYDEHYNRYSDCTHSDTDDHHDTPPAARLARLRDKLASIAP